jgi:hypothetical protein
MRRDGDPSFTAHRHSRDTDVPAFDHFAGSEFKPKRFPFFVRFLREDLSAPAPSLDELIIGLLDESALFRLLLTVKYFAVLKFANVPHLNFIAFLGCWTGAELAIIDDNTLNFFNTKCCFAAATLWL